MSAPQDGRPSDPRQNGGCPYREVADTAFWSKAVAGQAAQSLDPVVAVPFKITREDKIATAGSCFAQHISKRLSAAQYNYFVVESGYPRMPDALRTRFNYGTFSARYGNIYSARQLLQLMNRAYDEFVPTEPFWRSGSHWVDPFRPFIQPNGFETLQEAELDRAQHLWAVRALLETLDIFVFTLGLTETWICKEDGSVLPVCPGCGVGTFDADRYAFKNFEVEEIIADLSSFMKKLRRVNPNARVILTVSPVPLVATYSGNHVLPATTYSKSVLRVAADRIARSEENCVYFPSYEIVTGAFNRGQYFEKDLRSVSEAGVDHVMKVFFRHFSAEPLPVEEKKPAPEPAPATLGAIDGPRARTVLDEICDEYVSLNSIAEDR